MTNGVVRAGWSRTRVPITSGMLVIDIGSGAFPHPRADILCDRELEDNLHRAGLAAVVDRPFVIADVTALPFRDGGVDFVIVSHLAEHVTEPAAMCRELARVARSGYIETPSPIADWLLDEEYHLWRVGTRKGVLEFRRKRPKGALARWLTDGFYKIFYSAQPSCHRPVYGLPRGTFGCILRFVVTAFGALLNRSGIMHTRVHFGPDHPLECREVT